MEPLSAVGLAASILQFVEFTAKLINKGNEIRSSIEGTTAENRDLETAARSLVLLTRQISSRFPSQPKTPVDEVIHDLAASCEVIANELISALDKLKSSDKRKWTGVVDALRTVMAKDNIDNLRDRVEKCRTGIQTALLVSLR